MNRTAKLSIAASVAIASLLMGCGPSVPEHDQQGGIMSGNEIAAESAKHDTLVDRTPVGVAQTNTMPASTRHVTTAPAAAESAPPPGTAVPAGNVSPADAPVGSPPAPSAVPVAPAPVAPAPTATPVH